MLCEDILLNIFRHFLAATLRIWPILAWVCQRWRQILFASPLGLNLRLYCTHGTPVLENLDIWPALPVIVEYGGVPNVDPPTPEEDDNIIAALKQSDRVSSISLTVTSSLLEKLSAISEPLYELEELVLLSQDNVQRTLPCTFLWGPRLRTLHSTRIAFPSLPSLLLPCQNLVDLQLHEIPSSGYFSPEAFANFLSGTPQLRSLTLHILSFPRRQSYLVLPPPSGERTVLAALTRLKYRGTSKYLDSFVGRIDAPRLGDIEITLFNQPTMDALQLGQFIQRTEIHTSLSHAEVETSAHAISISFTTDSDEYTPLRVQTSCKQLDWQLSCMAQICDQISPFLFHVGHLGINAAQLPDEQDDVDGEQWLDLLRSFKFGGAENLRVNGKLTAGILCALSPANEENTTMLPSLRQVHLEKPIAMDGPSWDSVRSFKTARWISGRPVKVEAPSYQCHICHVGFQGRNGYSLKFHLKDKHGYQIVCSYCNDFALESLGSRQFLKHLEREHYNIVWEDHRVTTLFFQLRSSNDLRHLNDYDPSLHEHTSLRPPDVVPHV